MPKTKTVSALPKPPKLRYARGGRTRALTQWVLSTLVRGGARPGDKLPTEHELSARFRVSRSTVRQALKALDSFGLVDARPRRGSMLKAANPQDIAPLFAAAMVLGARPPRGADADPGLEDAHLHALAEARWVLERSLLPLACARHTPGDLHAMEKAEAGFRKAGEAGDHPARREADAAYHRALVAAAHNPVLSGLTELIDGYFGLLTSRGGKTPPKTSSETTLKEHAAIRKAIGAGDAETAIEILDRHLKRALS